jgi:aminoglycoside phosphotransferase (APT) family kinase protein
MLASLAAACGESLADVYPRYKALTGFANTHRREVEVYDNLANGMQPEIFGLHADDAAGSYVILMEYLEDVSLLNSVMRPGDWTDAHLRQALGQLAAWHAAHLGKAFSHRPGDAPDSPCRTYMTQLSPLWEALLDNAARRFPGLYTPARVQRMQTVIAGIPAYWQELEKMPRTLVHNDLNPRNTCFKGAGPDLRFCAYDWELATCHVPQYDVVELLCFVLERERYAQRGEYLEFYRQALHDRTGLYADAQGFRRGFALAARDFGLHRLGLYMMGHSVSPYPFLPRVVESYFDTLAQMDENL